MDEMSKSIFYPRYNSYKIKSVFFLALVVDFDVALKGFRFERNSLRRTI
jgi:hypothetical protein